MVFACGVSLVFAFGVSLTTAVAAEPRKCANQNEPRLTGDAFVPVECSSGTAKVAELPGAPPAASSEASLKELAGRWEGFAIAGFGRYELLAELEKPGWTGRTKGRLRTKEQQLRQRSSLQLAFAPAGKGRWKVELSAEALPGASLAGEAWLGLASSTAAPKGSRQLDLRFENGAAHRVLWLPKDGRLELKAWSAAPGAPLRSFELSLKPATRDSL